MEQTAHIVPHTHWDREWYLPFEAHRYRMVGLIDSLLDAFDAASGPERFFLDGQTILLEDYLAVRPDRRERLEHHIREGRLEIGPWYVLQDEFLVSGEATVRNLLVGRRICRSFGARGTLGYFPDAFGNAGQMPQLMRQAGMEAVVFGRGIRAVGPDNDVGVQGRYDSAFSELIWAAPDGTDMLAILFANWYNNGNEIPVSPSEANAYWEQALSAAGRVASTEHLLFMNGCDHQPMQPDLRAAIQTASDLFPHIQFRQSGLSEYVRTVAAAVPDTLPRIEGELTSQETDGWFTLVNTSSARVDLKRMNQAGQTRLERMAEPLALLADLHAPGSWPAHWFDHAWRVLMQNHPHDSICGCSIDAVNREMRTRFEKSRVVADMLVDDATSRLAGAIDTAAASGDPEALPVVVFNTSGHTRTGLVEVTLDRQRVRTQPLHVAYRTACALDARTDRWHLVDGEGCPVECRLSEGGTRFGYELPDDRFRRPYAARSLHLAFEATVPALGYRTYTLVPCSVPTEVRPPSGEVAAIHSGNRPQSLIAEPHRMENESLIVRIRENGTIDLTHRATGRTYAGLCLLEDSGDIGNEYVFVQASDRQPRTTSASRPEIQLVEDTPLRATYRIRHLLTVPASADDRLEHEQQAMVPLPDRKAGRSAETVSFAIDVEVSLEHAAPRLDVRCRYDNTARDHRLRMRFPTDLHTDTHVADSVFEVVRRPNRPSGMWRNPSVCHHQQTFCGMDDGTAGLAILQRGLHEYEVLPDTRNTLAVTLLRAVGEMGDWGWFPTPESQLPGQGLAELALVPHAGEFVQSAELAQAGQFQSPMLAMAVDRHPGRLPASNSYLDWSGTGLELTAAKRHEQTQDAVLRWVNLSTGPVALRFRPRFPHCAAYRSDVMENQGDTLWPDKNGDYHIEVRGAEIVTVGITRQEGCAS